MLQLLAVPVALVLLAGCAGDPQAQLRSDAAAVIDAANSGDAGAVRDRAAALEQTVAELRADGTLQDDRAAELTDVARSLVVSADVIDTELLEQQRRDAEAEAERERLEEERARLEAEREQLEEDRKKADEEREKGKGKKDDDEGADD